jgi:hypothetical protein
MQDIVSRADVYASMLEQTPPASLLRRRPLRDFAAACRTRLRHNAPLLAFEGEPPAPAWKRAFAHAIAIEDFFRACSPSARAPRPRSIDGHVPDVVTEEAIIDSIGGRALSTLLRLHEDSSKLETYLRAELGRADYGERVRSGETPAWERAFGMVLYTQDVLRWLSGYTRGGKPRVGAVDLQEPAFEPATPSAAATVLPYIPPEEPDFPREVDAAAWQREAAKLAGYTYDPSQKNGGIGGFEPEYEVENDSALPPEQRAKLKPPLVLRGPLAFLSVEGCSGRPEVAWYYSGSPFELGMSSNFDGMVEALMNGGVASGSAGPSSGPSKSAQRAAGMQKRYRRELAKLPFHSQAVFELAYTDRTYPTEMVSQYGEGVVALVWRAQQLAQEGTVGPGTLAGLVEIARADWPTYRKVVNLKGSKRGVALRRACKAVAELILWTAHFRYGAHWKPPERRGKPQVPVQVEDRRFVVAGTKGRRKRRLVEDQRGKQARGERTGRKAA